MNLRKFENGMKMKPEKYLSVLKNNKESLLIFNCCVTKKNSTSSKICFCDSTFES